MDNLMQYKDKVKSCIKKIKCPVCKEILLAKHWTKHKCSNAKRNACPWCFGKVVFKRGEKRIFLPHLVECYSNFMKSNVLKKIFKPTTRTTTTTTTTMEVEVQKSPEEEEEEVLPTCCAACSDFYSKPYPRRQMLGRKKLVCVDERFYKSVDFFEDVPKWLDLPTVVDDPELALVLRNGNVLDNEMSGLNKASDWVKRYLVYGGEYRWYHLMVRAVAFGSFLDALSAFPKDVCILPYWCLCDGKNEKHHDPSYVHHRHMILVTRLSGLKFENAIWKRVSCKKPSFSFFKDTKTSSAFKDTNEKGEDTKTSFPKDTKTSSAFKDANGKEKDGDEEKNDSTKINQVELNGAFKNTDDKNESIKKVANELNGEVSEVEFESDYDDNVQYESDDIDDYDVQFESDDDNVELDNENKTKLKVGTKLKTGNDSKRNNNNDYSSSSCYCCSKRKKKNRFKLKNRIDSVKHFTNVLCYVSLPKSKCKGVMRDEFKEICACVDIKEKGYAHHYYINNPVGLHAVHNLCHLYPSGQSDFVLQSLGPRISGLYPLVEKRRDLNKNYKFYISPSDACPEVRGCPIPINKNYQLQSPNRDIPMERAVSMRESELPSHYLFRGDNLMPLQRNDTLRAMDTRDWIMYQVNNGNNAFMQRAAKDWVALGRRQQTFLNELENIIEPLRCGLEKQLEAKDKMIAEKDCLIEELHRKYERFLESCLEAKK